MEAQLVTPKFPRDLAHIWNAWARIRRRKASGFNGPEPISWTDIDTFLTRSGAHLSPADIEFIEILDDAFLASFSAGPSPEEQKLALRDSVERIASK